MFPFIDWRKRKMDIVILSEFCEDFSRSDNDRFLYLAKLLSEENQVEIVTSTFLHSKKIQRYEPVDNWDFKITFIKEPGYPRNICLKRFYSHYVWGRNVAAYLKKRKKPDVIYCAVPSLTGPNLVARYCKKERIRFIIDVQDLWPEAFRMVLNIPIISHVLFCPFVIMANGIYKRADAICAVSDTYCARAFSVNRRVKYTTTVYLGTDLEKFDSYSKGKPILEKKENEIWVAYCGTLGSSYDIKCVIDAIERIGNPLIKLVVMGDGPLKEDFETYAAKKGINVSFTGRLQYNEMCSLLSECDIAVNPITHLAAQSIINKHADYAASGIPVVSTQESDEYKELVDRYKMGFNCKNSNSIDLSEKLSFLVNNIDVRKKMGANARLCAEECFNRKRNYILLRKEIEKKQVLKGLD